MDYSKLTIYLVGSFLILNLGIGLWFGRKSTSMRDYALANKSYGTGPLVMTYLATILSGFWLFYLPKDIVEDGLGTFFIIVGIALSMVIRGLFIAPKMLPFRNCLSLGDIIGQLYGKESKILAGFLSVLFSSLVAGINISCIGLIAEKFLNISSGLGIFVGGVIIVIYSAIGGMRAVAATDIVQFIFGIAVIVILGALCVKKIGGLGELFMQLPAQKFDICSSKKFYYYVSVIIVDVLFSSEMVNPARLDRMLMAKSPFHLKKMLYITSISSVLIFGVITVTALSASILYKDLDTSNIILYLFDNVILSKSIKGLAIIGMLAVVLSTVDSFIHSAGVGLAHDIIKPLSEQFNFKLNELRWAKYGAFIVGAFAIWFAIWGRSLFRADICMSIVAPTLLSPLILGILGVKPEKKAFWQAALFSIFTFALCKIFLKSPYESLALPIPVFVNAIVYMISHIQINNGIMLVKHEGYNAPEAYHWKPNIERVLNVIVYLITYPFHFVERCRDKVEKYGAPYELFGIFYCILLVAPYFLWEQLPAAYENIILYLRLIGVVLCSLLMTASIWPRSYKNPYLPAFWYISIIYCIPFLSTILLLFTNGGTEYIINIAITIMLLILLVDWGSALVMGIVGAALAYFVYKNLMYEFVEVRSINFGFSSKYQLIYQVVLGSLIGLLFASRKQRLFNRQKLNIGGLSVVLDVEREQFKELQSITNRIVKGLGMREIDMMSRIETMEKFCEEVKQKNSTDKSLLEKSTNTIATIKYLQNLVQIAKSYMKLDVKNVHIDKILSPMNQFAKECVKDNYSIVLRSDYEHIQCDDKKLNYVLCQGIYDVFKNNVNEDHLTIDISDTKLSYKLPSFKDYNKVLDALLITISTASYIDKNIFKEVYDVPYKNPKQVLPIDGFVDTTDRKDITVIAERILEAQCGITDVLLNTDGYTKIYVIPKKLREVRSAPLDLETPEEIIITWPGALDLENELKEQIKQKAPKVDLNKIDKALDVIKKYHSHQTRKSGEPYYLHPVHVALIELEWCQEEAAILGALMHDLLEDTAFTIFDIKTAFGDRVAEVIFGVSKLDKDLRTFHSNEEHLRTLENITDFVTLSIKISDRIHNMRTIRGHKSAAKRKAIVEETIRFFMPLAKKLGLEKAYEELASLVKKELH
jgi:Na+/proline symporter